MALVISATFLCDIALIFNDIAPLKAGPGRTFNLNAKFSLHREFANFLAQCRCVANTQSLV